MTVEAPELCDVNWIGQYLGKSRSSVHERVISLPGFPEPVPGCRKPLKFVKRDVIRYLTEPASRPRA